MQLALHALAVLAIVAFGAPAGAGQQVAEGFIRIDGAKNPELLPEYLIWQHVFLGLDLVKQKGMPLPDVALKGTAKDRERLFETSAWHVDQARQCMERQQRKVDMLRAQLKTKLTPKDIDAAQKEVILECRQEVLDRAASLLSQLSDEARLSLLEYAEGSKSGIWALVLKNELEFFRKPR